MVGYESREKQAAQLGPALWAMIMTLVLLRWKAIEVMT